MHLCIDARMLHASGIGTYLQNLLPALLQHYELTLIGDREALSVYNVHTIHTDIPIYSIADIIRFPGLVPACDVFWSPHYNVPLRGIPAKRRIVTIHDVFHLAFFKTLSLKQKIYAKLLLNAAVRLSQHVVIVSAFSKAELIAHTGAQADKIRVIHNGVDHNKFKPVDDKSLLEQVKKKYQLPDKFLLFVGNVKPHKNLISLLQAFARIKEQIPSHALVVVGKKEGFITGDSALFDFLKQDEALTKRVLFTGFVADQDLPALYSSADLFVFPSLYEGFGLPPLEAMACGCLTLTSDKASLPEVCGNATSYTPPQDIQLMSEQILQLLDMTATRRQHIVEKGIQQAQLFTWQTAIAQHRELFDSLI